jgi:hypothetical protein
VRLKTMIRSIAAASVSFGLLTVGCSSSSTIPQDAGGIGGGAIVTTGGASSAGGSSSVAGSSAVGGTSAVKTSNASVATGGAVSSGGSAATGGQSGKPLAKAGDKTSTTNDYLNLGNMRLLNNNWGSVELQKQGKTCTAPMSVNVNSDGSLGWTFNRGGCGDDGSHPDYPELEFGVAPFGYASSLLTSPTFSSTTLLPIQVSKIQSASVSIGSFSIQLNSNTNWNLNIEFWLSKLDPLTNADAQAYTEIMGLWGWSAGAEQWKCNVSGQTVTSGGKSYSLCHQSDSWGSGSKWRFFQFQASSSQQSFSGTLDVKAFLDWFYASSYGAGVSKDYYLTRIELGSEIDDNTSGSCTIKNVSFTINGTTQGPLLGH